MKAKFLTVIVAIIIASSQFAICQTVTKKDSVPQKDSVYYSCSMHPEIHSATPGTCPKCGMQLIKIDSKHPQKKSHNMMMGCGMMMGNMNSMNTQQNGNQTQDSIRTNKVEYTCPMHPEVLSDKAGSCPKCGMDLVEMKKH